MNAKRLLGLLVLSGVLLDACGGGGGGGGTPPPPAPTVTISVDPAKVPLGQSATVTWSSTEATSCTASNAWTGAQATSGSALVTPTSGGQFNYTLACSGVGGTGSDSVTLVVPMPVFASSYENRKKIVLSDPNLPTAQAIRNSDPDAFGDGTFENLSLGEFAFADFFQEGSYSAVVNMVHHNPDLGYYDVPAKIYFLRKNSVGNWVEETSGKLSDQTGCIQPRKTLVADFNGDCKPDVFFACHGLDTPPYPGEPQRVLLSQGDGSYSNTQVGPARFTHGGSAADLNGDGKPDLVLNWTNTPDAVPYVLVNNGNGTFTEDLSRLSIPYGRLIIQAELVDTEGTGNFDLLLGGYSPDATGRDPDVDNAFPNGMFKNDGNGYFLNTPYVVFPSPAGSTGLHYNVALDFIFLNGVVYVSQELNYENMIVHKVKLSDLSVTTAYEHLGPYSGGCGWFAWIYPTADGRIVSQSSSVETPIDPQSCQGVSFPQ